MARTLLRMNTRPLGGRGLDKHQILPGFASFRSETSKDSICCVEALVGYYMVGVKGKNIENANQREMALDGKKAIEGKGIFKKRLGFGENPFVYHFEDSLSSDRFCNVVIHTSFKALFPVAFHGMRRNGDNRNMFQSGRTLRAKT